MITVNGYKIGNDTYPDGTFLIKSLFKNGNSNNMQVGISWYYENESELAKLMYITKDLKSKGYNDINLILPYVPNARMDRVKYDSDIFMLKYFAEFINSLGFSKVFTFDVHSDVAPALIERCVNKTPENFIYYVIRDLNLNADKDFVIYPDAGCKKRLDGLVKFPSIFADKNRDWRTGEITSTSLYGDLTRVEGARVLFVDDICSYGGTAMYTLKALKELGAKECYCCFSHVEKSIFGKKGWQETGEGTLTLLNSGLVSKIFCTDSLISKEYVKEHNFSDIEFHIESVRFAMNI